MAAALRLEALIVKVRAQEPLTINELQDLYKQTWKEAYRNAQEDQRAVCHCGEFEEDE